MRCYNWDELKREFLTGDYKTLKEFAEAKSINYGVLRNKARDWLKEKEAIDREKNQQILEKTLQRQIETAADRNALHVEIWDRFLMLVWTVLNDEKSLRTKDGRYNVYALERLANIMEKAQKGQRLALGLDEENKEDQSEQLISRIREIVSALWDDDQDDTMNAECC